MTATPHTPRALSEAQRRTLAKLAIADGSAYSINATLGTLRALSLRGLVTSSGGLGSMAFPQNERWRITKAGRAALSEENKP